MDSLEESVRRLLLAGVGAAAATAEKSQELLDELVKRGEQAIAQGQVLNEELRHGIKQAIRETPTVNAAAQGGDALQKTLAALTPEQLAALKAQIEALQSNKEAPERGDAKDGGPGR